MRALAPAISQRHMHSKEAACQCPLPALHFSSHSIKFECERLRCTVLVTTSQHLYYYPMPPQTHTPLLENITSTDMPDGLSHVEQGLRGLTSPDLRYIINAAHLPFRSFNPERVIHRMIAESI